MKVIEDPHQCGVASVERHRRQLLEDTSRRCINILLNCVMYDAFMRQQISRLHGGRWSSAADHKGIRLDVIHHNRTTTGAVEWNTGVSMIFSMVCTSGTCTTWTTGARTDGVVHSVKSEGATFTMSGAGAACTAGNGIVCSGTGATNSHTGGASTTGAVTNAGAESAGSGAKLHRSSRTHVLDHVRR